jgi:glutamyl-tRNA synthetase
MRWFGLQWQEGPDIGGEFGPYCQSERHSLYLEALKALQATGRIYPCTCSRKDIQSSASAPHATDDEPIYPGTCRNKKWPDVAGRNHCWRLRLTVGEEIAFVDGQFGPVKYVVGKDFGDFVVWRPDQVASYQLATVVDDASMRITEVVRGADLLISTARQILLFNTLDLPIPIFRHCELMTDATGARLAKRTDGLSLRHLREQGMTPEEIREKFFNIENKRL